MHLNPSHSIELFFEKSVVERFENVQDVGQGVTFLN